MRLHFERMQAEKEADNRLKDAIREGRREGVMDLSHALRLLPTNPEVSDSYVSDELAMEQAKLRRLTSELESIQRRIVMTMKVKDIADQKLKISASQGGFKSRVGDAVANLTMFTKESTDEREEIALQLKLTQDYLDDLGKKIAKQQKKVDELKRLKVTTEEQIERSVEQCRKLSIAAEAADKFDFGDRIRQLKEERGK